MGVLPDCSVSPRLVWAYHVPGVTRDFKPARLTPGVHPPPTGTGTGTPRAGPRHHYLLCMGVELESSCSFSLISATLSPVTGNGVCHTKCMDTGVVNAW